MNSSESFEINLVGGTGAVITKESLKNLTIEDLKLSLEIMNNKQKNHKYDNWSTYIEGFNIGHNEKKKIDAEGTFRYIISKGATVINDRNKKNGTLPSIKIRIFKTQYLKMFQDELISRLNLKEEIMNLARSSFCINNNMPDSLVRSESIENIKAALALI